MTLSKIVRRGGPAALLLGLWAGAMATPGADEPPPPQPARAVVVPAMHEHRLDNGLSVIVAPRSGVPLVHVLLLVRAGSEADAPGRAGTSGMLAALLTKGATRNGRAVGAAEIARQAEVLGGSLDASGGWRSTSLGMTVTPSKLAAALALVADSALRPTLAAEEFERARTQTLDGLRVSRSNPSEVAGWVVRRAYWGNGAYGATATEGSLQRMRPDDVRAFHRTWFRPDRAAVVLAGDVDPAQGLALVQRLFGRWPATREAAPDVPPAAALPMAERSLLLDMPGSGQSAVMLAMPFAAVEAPQRRVAQLAQAVLGGGYSARLNQEVRIKRGLSYGAYADAESHPGAGMLLAQAQTSHANAAQVLQLMRDEAVRLGRDAPVADELAARQATLVGSFGRRVETAGGLASLVAGQWVQRKPLADLAHYVDEVLAVTPEQVRAWAQAAWTPEALRGVVAGELKAAGAGLDALPPPVRRIDAARLDLDAATLEAAR